MVGGGGQLNPRGLSEGRMVDRRLLGEDSNPGLALCPIGTFCPRSRGVASKVQALQVPKDVDDLTYRGLIIKRANHNASCASTLDVYLATIMVVSKSVTLSIVCNP